SRDRRNVGDPSGNRRFSFAARARALQGGAPAHGGAVAAPRAGGFSANDSGSQTLFGATGVVRQEGGLVTELRRLIDECDSELGQAILRAGREHAGDEVRRGRVLAALGVGAVVTASAKSTFAFSAAFKSVAWKKVLVGGVVAGGGFAGAALYQASPPPVEAP